MHVLPPLPYAEDALEPHMSAETLRYHHGKHHRTYVDTLNDLISGTADANLTLDELIKGSAGADDAGARKVFNNAAQHWNHSFLWNSMSPAGGGEPEGDLAKMIEHTFGGFEAFGKEFIAQGKAHFGSGWIWLIRDSAGVALTTTHDADLPLAHGQTALICCDLWEHAYYIDHRNDRAKFLQTFLTRLANWDFAADNLADATELVSTP